MSVSNNSDAHVSLQKPDGQPINLPSTDEYGSLLPQLLSEPRFCKISWGISWVIKPFELFKDNFSVWLAVGLIFCVASLIGAYVPIVEVFFNVISIIIIGVIILICAAQAQNEDLDFTELWLKLKVQLKPLIILSLLFVVGIVVVLIPLLILFGFMSVTASLDIEAIKLQEYPMGALIFSGIVSLVLFLLLLMAMWFAPALIILHGLEPKIAMKSSLKGFLANLLPMIVYSLIGGIILLFFLSITLGFGIVIALPWVMMNHYISYRDVWTDQPLSAI